MTARPVPDDRHNSWRDDAACLDHPTEWFTGPHEPGDTGRAIDVCNTCPVRQPCLEAALQIEVSADLGIWGGSTPATRRRMRRASAEKSGTRESAVRRPGIAHLVNDQPSSTGRVELFEDSNGDYVDRTGRIIVFEIHGEPPMMLMIDGRPTARTKTVKDAGDLAAVLIRRETLDKPVPNRGGSDPAWEIQVGIESPARR